MMRIFAALLRRDLARLVPAMVLPVLFFLAVAMLYPFAVGPKPDLLAQSGAAIVWVAALLAALLPLDRLVAPDLDRGLFDQWRLRGISEEAVLAIRIFGHWLSFAPALLAASLPASALLGVPADLLPRLVAGLLLGTPGLAALGVAIAAITAGLRGGTALAGLLLVPLAIPVLIFGAGSLPDGDLAPLAYTAAASLMLVAIAPFAGGAAIRAARQ